MNQPSRPSLITTFFKSPPHTAEKQNGECSGLVLEGHDCGGCPVIPPIIEGISPTEVTNDEEDSRSSLVEGDMNMEMFAVNLSGLLCQSVGPRTLPEGTGGHCTHSSLLPSTNGLPSVLENGKDPRSTGGSGMKQGSLVWDTSSGKLGLKPAVPLATPSSAGETVRDEMELVVSVKRCHLVRIPTPGEKGGVGQAAPDTGSNTSSDVEVTHSLDPHDESCVIISASSPTPSSPPSHPTSLTGPWTKIFSHSNRQRVSSTPVSDGVSCPVAVSRTRSRIRSPKRHRSASSSPQPQAGSRSPHAHRSPARRSPLCSPHKGPPSPASPLRAAVKARKLSFHPPVTKKSKLESDHTPFAGLVHVRQEASSEPLWMLPPSKPLFNFRPISSAALPVMSSGLSLKSCLELLGEKERRGNSNPLAPIAPDKRDSVLKVLTDTHPQEKVQHIFQRYRQIREGVNTPLTGRSQQHYRVQQSHRNPLVCSIHIHHTVDKTIEVNRTAYSNRKSLRLRRKRSTSQSGDCEIMTETRKKKRVNIDTRSEVAGEVVDLVNEGGKGEAVTDLWTEVYRPQRKAEMIGNKMKIQQLHNWLQKWRNKRSQNVSNEVSKHDKRRWRRKLSDVQSQGSRENSPIPEWVHREGNDDFMSITHLRRKKRVVLGLHSSEEEEEEEERGECDGEEGEGVTSVLLLCGPVGSGKTAAVYSCAAELGFKVFEVNSSSVRSRGSLLTTLKEATLSHHVSTQPKPTQPLGSITSSLTQPLKEVGRSPAGRRGGRKKPLEGGLLSFFKPQSEREGRAPPKRREGDMTTDHSTNERQNSAQVSLETSTVVLLEEVDILFDSDRGFWSGVYDVIETTRRPIILTCNDPRYDLDCEHLKIVLEPPSLVELGLHAQLLCLSHDRHMSSEAAVELADRLHADIRRVFLSLQFWTTPTTTHPPSLNQLAGLPPHHWCREGRPTTLSPPHLPLPWQTSPAHRATSTSYEEMDTAAHCAEQYSYVDTVSMERRSHDRHVMYVDDIMRPWWVCPEECDVLDELPVRECVWREEMVNGALCEEVTRGVGGVVRSEPLNTMFWTELSRHVGSVRQCLKRCAQLFSPHNSQVGVATDGLPFLRTICSCEGHREECRTKRRFRHYLQAAVVDQSDLRTLPLTTRFPVS